MTYFSFQKAVDAMRADLKADVLERLPIATAAALSRTAIKCRDEMKVHISKAFDRPTPYALNAARAVPATKERLTSAVLLREFGGKGTPAEKYLGAEIEGGARGQKRAEKSLIAAGFLTAGGYATPGDKADIDQFGNQTSSEISKILSVLRAFGEQGYKANRTKGWGKKTRVGQIFAVKAGSNRGGLKPGVYKRTATGVVALMIFVKKAPEYRVRLPFNELVKADAARLFPAELDKALIESAGWKRTK